jgi:hypothetical protein
MATTASLLLLLAAAPSESTAVMDLRGHTGEQIHRTLDAALPLLTACLKPAPIPERRTDRPAAPVVVLPSTQELVLAVAQTGAVASVEVKEPGRLDTACVVKELRKLEFGRSTGSASMTLVRVPVTCELGGCRYPWTTKR